VSYVYRLTEVDQDSLQFLKVFAYSEASIFYDEGRGYQNIVFTEIGMYQSGVLIKSAKEKPSLVLRRPKP
jgi:hypothetical protein